MIDQEKIRKFTGTKLGKLTAIQFVRSTPKTQIWLFKCDCGNFKEAKKHEFLRVWPRSCGCAPKKAKHGMTRKIFSNRSSPTYNSWSSMNVRCFNKKVKDYIRYGGRGITVCDRWKDFSLFLEDMGERPPNTSLERINNNGNYEPSNCKWGSMREQSRNKRNSKTVIYYGKKMDTTDLLRYATVEMNRRTLLSRIFYLKWSVRRALRTPINN